MSLKKLVKVVKTGTFANRRFFSLHKLSDEHRILQKTCRQFTETQLKPIASELDKNHKFPKEQIKKLGDLGLMGISANEKYGGSGLDTLSLAIAIEELSRGCGGTGVIVSVHNCLYVNLLNRFGTEEQNQKFLKPYTSGTLGCFALSEPNAGSDVGAICTTAVPSGDHYVLNGTKSWVTSGLEGQSAVIFATIDKTLKHRGITAFIVPLDSAGVVRGKNERKLGIRASSTCNLILEDVKVPKNNVLGNVGDGFKIAMQQLDNGRIGIAAQALGIGQAALELAVQYSGERIAFGQALNEFQAVKIRLAEMALRLEAARLLVWRAAILNDDLTGKTTKETSMAKLAASEAANFITHNCIQILGGMGYVEDMPAERYYRDARITEIYGGVTDVQKIVIGGLIVKEYQ